MSRFYRGEVIYWVKGSVYVLFSLQRVRGRKRRECKFQNKGHRTFEPINSFTPVQRYLSLLSVTHALCTVSLAAQRNLLRGVVHTLWTFLNEGKLLRLSSNLQEEV